MNTHTVSVAYDTSMYNLGLKKGDPSERDSGNAQGGGEEVEMSGVNV